MMAAQFQAIISQVDPGKLEPDAPQLNHDGSTAMTWIIVAVLVAGIIAITFKTSKRNAVLDKDL